MRVETNVKVGCALELGPKTLIVGPRGSGKSTVVNALELALTGRVGDVAGRADIATQADLWSLAPPDASEIYARVTWDDGEVSEWRMRKGKRPSRGGPAGVLPLRDVRAGLLGNAETARKWLVGLMGGGSWRAGLGGDLYALAAGLPDDLTSALEQAKAAERRTRDESKGARSATSSAGLAAPPTDAEWEAAMEWERFGTFASLRADLARQDAEVERYAAEVAALPPPVADVRGDVPTAHALNAVVTIQLASGADRCGVCGRPDVTGPMLMARKAKIEAFLTAHAAAVTAAITRHSMTEALARVTALRDRTRAVLADAPTFDAPPPRLLADLQALRAAWDQVQRANEQADRLDADADRWGRLASRLGEALRSAAADGAARFEAAVQAHLPRGLAFGIDPETGRVGLRRAGGLQTALSGAEWATVTLALALASDGAGPRVIAIPEERAFDPESLGDTLRAWAAAPSQIVVTSPVLPAGPVPGWTIIRRPADQAPTTLD